MGPKLKQIVAQVGPTLPAKRPAYVYDYKAVDALRPFVPRLAVYGFSNYRPAPGTPPPAEARKVPPSMPGLWERAANDDRPQYPRLLLIPTTPEVFIGYGDPVINWHSDRRKDYEYECELLGIVGRSMRRVPVDQVKNYMFGYANTNDISDRQERQPDPIRQDWLVQKGWDSMKPVGPFVVPQEFVDPLNMRLKMTVAGQQVQDSNTNQAWHSMYEYAAYLSNMLTVPVGTVIGLGSSLASVPKEGQVSMYEIAHSLAVGFDCTMVALAESAIVWYVPLLAVDAWYTARWSEWIGTLIRAHMQASAGVEDVIAFLTIWGASLAVSYFGERLIFGKRRRKSHD